MRRVVFFVGILFFANHAFASNWLPISTMSNNGQLFVDLTSFIWEGNFVKVWTLMSFPTPVADNQFGIFKTMRQEFLIDCAHQQIAILEAYPDNGAGAEIYPEAAARIALADPVPDTTNEIITHWVCDHKQHSQSAGTLPANLFHLPR